MTPIRLAATLVIVIALHVGLRAQDLTGTIDGVMRAPDGSPPAGLQVRASSDDVVVTTDPAADGTFRFTDLPLGNYRVQAVDSTGRVLAGGTARLTPGVPSQSITLRLRAGRSDLGGRFAEPASFYAGPFGVTPSAALLNVGVDGNVFNDADDPKSDTAFIFDPAAAVTLDAGPVRGDGQVHGRYLYFDKYSGERSLNVDADGRLEATAGRLTPWATGFVDGGRRRINHEIDLRARQLRFGVEGGVDARVAARTIASVAVARRDYGFDPDQIFLGANLQELLNRKVIATTVEGRQALTDSISALGQVNVTGERFRFSPQRDVNILRLQGGLLTTGGDRASGSVRLGYIRLNAIGTAIADYRGFVASIDEDLQLGSRTRLRITGARDIDYSYETLYADYLRTGAVIDLRAQLSSAWDADVRADGERILHLPAPGLTAARYSETYGFFGGGLGVRIGGALRLGVEGGGENRSSPIDGRSFTGYRAGASITVGTRPWVCGCGFE